MAGTRFYDDPCRINKQLQQSTGPGRYALDVPGPFGDKPCFPLDPQVIPQKWGANLWSDTIDLQSGLLGLDKRLNKDCINVDYYRKLNITSSPLKNNYPLCSNFLTTEQSRAINPAWNIKGTNTSKWDYLYYNPQDHYLIPFESYVDTRIKEKNSFVRNYDCLIINNYNGQELPNKLYDNNYIAKTNICTNTNSCEKI